MLLSSFTSFFAIVFICWETRPLWHGIKSFCSQFEENSNSLFSIISIFIQFLYNSNQNLLWLLFLSFLQLNRPYETHCNQVTVDLRMQLLSKVFQRASEAAKTYRLYHLKENQWFISQTFSILSTCDKGSVLFWFWF